MTIEHQAAGTGMPDGGSVPVKIASALRAANDFNRDDATNLQRNQAIDLFRVLARDPDVPVRRALAEALGDNPLIPHDVAATLAADVAEVALPMLQHSLVLADEDLLEIVRDGSASHCHAIARRDQVSPGVAHALFETRSEQVLLALVRNPGADIAEATYDAIFRTHAADSDIVRRAVAHRFLTLLQSVGRHPNLAPKLAERVVFRVAERLAEQLSRTYADDPGIVVSLAEEARERATASLVAAEATPAEAEGLARHLEAMGRLTPTLFLRALAQRRVALAAALLAVKAGGEAEVAEQAIRKGDARRLAAFAAAAGWPDGTATAGAWAARAIAAAAQAEAGEAHAAYVDAFLGHAAEALGIQGAVDPDALPARILAFAPVKAAKRAPARKSRRKAA